MGERELEIPHTFLLSANALFQGLLSEAISNMFYSALILTHVFTDPGESSG